MGHRHKESLKLRKAILEALQKGIPQRDIAVDLGVSRQTVYVWARHYKGQYPPARRGVYPDLPQREIIIMLVLGYLPSEIRRLVCPASSKSSVNVFLYHRQIDSYYIEYLRTLSSGDLESTIEALLTPLSFRKAGGTPAPIYRNRKAT